MKKILPILTKHSHQTNQTLNFLTSLIRQNKPILILLLIKMYLIKFIQNFQIMQIIFIINSSKWWVIIILWTCNCFPYLLITFHLLPLTQTYGIYISRQPKIIKISFEQVMDNQIIMKMVAISCILSLKMI